MMMFECCGVCGCGKEYWGCEGGCELCFGDFFWDDWDYVYFVWFWCGDCCE